MDAQTIMKLWEPSQLGVQKKKRLISKTKVRKERKSDTGWTNNSDPGHTRFRSSHRRCSVRKAVLRNFAKFTRKHLCQSLFFNKVLGWPATLLKRRLWNRCFSVNFEKLLRTSFSQRTAFAAFGLEHLRTTIC